MRRIRVPLHNKQGEVVAHAVVDEEDAWVAKHRWYLDASGYVRRDSGRRCTRLHRDLLGLMPGDGRAVDHRNGDKLDNRRANLRIASQAENCQNVRTRKGGMRGVYQDQRDGAWYGQVKHRGKRHSTSRFPTPEQAQAAVAALRAEVLPFAEPAS